MAKQVKLTWWQEFLVKLLQKEDPKVFSEIVRRAFGGPVHVHKNPIRKKVANE